MATHSRRAREEDRAETRALEKKLDEWGWGLFFIWVAIAFLADFGWGLGLVGVGIITLGGQAARLSYGLALDEFWSVLGLLFIVGGGWELMFESQFPLVPAGLFMDRRDVHLVGDQRELRGQPPPVFATSPAPAPLGLRRVKKSPWTC